MKLLIINIFILIAANKVYTKYVSHSSSTQPPKTSELSETSPTYEYKEVILYLTPTEIEEIKQDNKLLNEHLKSQHNLKYKEESNLYTEENKYIYPTNNDKLTIEKQVDESQASKQEYPTSESKQEIKTPTLIPYTKDLLLNNAEKNDGQNFRYIFINLKKTEEDKVREQSDNPWISINSKPKELNLKTLSPQDSHLLEPAYNYKNVFSVAGLPRLYGQRELEKQALYI